jgi:hypothetical protein
MTATPRELWLLNFYRNSELHGALLMGRLARTYADGALAANLTRHCATEARHAALLTEAVEALDGRLDLETGTIQQRYGDAGGVPAELLDLLVLSEALEARVLASYRAHLQRADVSPTARTTLEAILREMEAEGGDPHAGWIDRALDRFPPDAVASAKARWKAVDARVAGELTTMLEQRFAGAPGAAGRGGGVFAKASASVAVAQRTPGAPLVAAPTARRPNNRAEASTSSASPRAPSRGERKRGHPERSRRVAGRGGGATPRLKGEG